MASSKAAKDRLFGWRIAAYNVFLVLQETAMDLRLECEPEVDGRWLAEVFALPGVLAYGSSAAEAANKAEALVEGFSTQDGYRWLCNAYFEDFLTRFGWSVSE